MHLVAAMAVGIGAAAATSLFKEALESCGFVLFGSNADVVLVFTGLALATRVAIPAFGGMMAGGLLCLSNAIERRRPLPGDYMDAIASGDGKLPPLATLLRSMSSFFSILTGSSVGKEGAMIQLAALCGAVCPLPKTLQDVELRRMLTACGAAAGLASVYHTPLAASVFISEIVFGTLSVQRLMPLFLSSVSGAIVSSWHGGLHPLYPGVTLSAELGYQVLLAAALLGLAAGLCGALFLVGINRAKQLFRILPGGQIARLTLGGALVGVMAIVVPEVVGNGYFAVQSILLAEPLSTSVLVVFLMKILATIVSIGSGAIGGVFTPSLFIGAALGQLTPHFAASAGAVLPLVGMAAFLTATSHAPLMSVLMVFEMTLMPGVLLPCMVGAVAAYVSASGFRSLSLYGVVMERTLSQDAEARMRAMRLAALCGPTDTTVLATATLDQASAKFAASGTRYLYALDTNGQMVGGLALETLHRALRSANPPEHIGSLVEQAFPMLTPDARVPEALAIFSRHPMSRIPIVRDTDSREFVGAVSRDCLLDLGFSYKKRQ
ncbi:ClcB-like voltage-gated chloride channel protein [Cupriavidus basilensis]